MTGLALVKSDWNRKSVSLPKRNSVTVFEEVQCKSEPNQNGDVAGRK